MLSHSRNLFSPEDLDLRRHRRAYRRRIIPSWKRGGRCTCAWCIPGGYPEDRDPRLSYWTRRGFATLSDHIDRAEVDAGHAVATTPWSARAFRLRVHARWVMTELARWDPRLTGMLGELDRLRFAYFEGVELAVDEGDLGAVAAHLASLGYRVERVRRGGRPALEAELLEPLVVLADDGVMPGITLRELEEGLVRLHGKHFAERFRVAWI